jgi:uncharacterized membrane protein YhaH (DUF805 family)
MNPAKILFGLFDWRGVLSRAAYRRNLSILVLVGLLIDRLDFVNGPASYVWTALSVAMGLSFDARRYHDMGRSAAWIVWANLIFSALAIVFFQFIPNVLDYVPLLGALGVDSSADAVFGRFVIPAIAGVIVGNVFQSIWLATASTATGENPYAVVSRRSSASASQKDDDGPDEAALQAMIDRHLAAQRNEPVANISPPVQRPNPLGAAPRQFGRRGR